MPTDETMEGIEGKTESTKCFGFRVVNVLPGKRTNGPPGGCVKKRGGSHPDVWFYTELGVPASRYRGNIMGELVTTESRVGKGKITSGCQAATASAKIRKGLENRLQWWEKMVL